MTDPDPYWVACSEPERPADEFTLWELGCKACGVKREAEHRQRVEAVDRTGRGSRSVPGAIFIRDRLGGVTSIEIMQ